MVRLPWRRPQRPSQRLLRAAGIDPKSAREATESDTCRDVAYRMAQRGSGTVAAILAAAEELLADEANYDVVMEFLEDVQNLVSHPIETLCSPQEITARLGPRCAVCWTTLADFWASVAAWCSQVGRPLESSEKILSVDHEELKALLWTANRTLPTGAKVGLVEAVLYEKAGGEPIPGYSHIAAALKITGQG